MMRNLLIIFSLLISSITIGQSLECGDILNYRQTDKGFTKSEYSQSIQVFAGVTYKFEIPVEALETYRFSFFANGKANQIMRFTILDSKDTLLHIPGRSKVNKKGACALVAYYNSITNKYEYPTFDFTPSTTDTYTVIVEVIKYKRVSTIKYESVDDEYFDDVESPRDVDAFNTVCKTEEDRLTGCLTVYIQKKKESNKQYTSTL